MNVCEYDVITASYDEATSGGGATADSELNRHFIEVFVRQ